MLHPIFYLWVFLLASPMVFGLIDLASTGRSRSPGPRWPDQVHTASGGRLIRIASILPPVLRPNSVPRSYTRLNSA